MIPIDTYQWILRPVTRLRNENHARLTGLCHREPIVIHCLVGRYLLHRQLISVHTHELSNRVDRIDAIEQLDLDANVRQREDKLTRG